MAGSRGVPKNRCCHDLGTESLGLQDPKKDQTAVGILWDSYKPLSGADDFKQLLAAACCLLLFHTNPELMADTSLGFPRKVQGGLVTEIAESLSQQVTYTAGCTTFGLAVENGFAWICNLLCSKKAWCRREELKKFPSELLLAGPCFVVSHLSSLSRDLSVQTWKHVSIGNLIKTWKEGKATDENDRKKSCVYCWLIWFLFGCMWWINFVIPVFAHMFWTG